MSRIKLADRFAALRERLAERPPQTLELPERRIRRATRRDFLLLGAGAAAAAAGLWWLQPDRANNLFLPERSNHALDTVAARLGLGRERRERFLDRALTVDDDVAEALYSPNRRVRTYSKSQVTELRNNYNGQTPDPEYLDTWRLEVSGLAAGGGLSLTVPDLLRRFRFAEQVTRLVCVEGWSAVAGWGGIRFADFLDEFPPAPGSRWAALESSVNLDASGGSDPYYVALDLETARHPQTLLATHLNGAPLTVEHGAPLRLVAPVKLGLKNIKAITALRYSVEQPADYWAQRGYSKYDGL